MSEKLVRVIHTDTNVAHLTNYDESRHNKISMHLKNFSCVVIMIFLYVSLREVHTKDPENMFNTYYTLDRCRTLMRYGIFYSSVQLVYLLQTFSGLQNLDPQIVVLSFYIASIHLASCCMYLASGIWDIRTIENFAS